MFKRKRCSVCGKKLELLSIETHLMLCREHIDAERKREFAEFLERQAAKTIEQRVRELEEAIAYNLVTWGHKKEEHEDKSS
jgi:hypothetical protein